MYKKIMGLLLTTHLFVSGAQSIATIQANDSEEHKFALPDYDEKTIFRIASDKISLNEKNHDQMQQAVNAMLTNMEQGCVDLVAIEVALVNYLMRGCSKKEWLLKSKQSSSRLAQSGATTTTVPVYDLSASCAKITLQLFTDGDHVKRNSEVVIPAEFQSKYALRTIFTDHQHQSYQLGACTKLFIDKKNNVYDLTSAIDAMANTAQLVVKESNCKKDLISGYINRDIVDIIIPVEGGEETGCILH